MVVSAQILLGKEFEKRKAKNVAYSLRAFARDLGISKTSLCDVMNGHRKLSVQNLEIISEKLGLATEVLNELKIESSPVSSHREILEGDELSLVEDWFYFAVLNLAKLSDARCSAEWISDRLGIPLETAALALNVLIEKNLIENVDGNMVRKSKPITTQSDIPSASIVEHHKQSIERALYAIEEVPVDLRDYTTVTYAINPEMLKEIKDHILNFHRKLGRLVDTDSPSEVYRLNIQFFPLTKPLQKEKI